MRRRGRPARAKRIDTAKGGKGRRDPLHHQAVGAARHHHHLRVDRRPSSWSTSSRAIPPTPSSAPTPRRRTWPRSTTSSASTSRCGSSTSSGSATCSRATWVSRTRRTSRRRASSRQSFPIDLELIIFSQIIAFAIAFPMAMHAARRAEPALRPGVQQHDVRHAGAAALRHRARSWCSSSPCTGTCSRARPPTCR